jgi:hypothetical protein
MLLAGCFLSAGSFCRYGIVTITVAHHQEKSMPKKCKERLLLDFWPHILGSLLLEEFEINGRKLCRRFL